MNLKQLEAFVSIADEGSFSRAAKSLFLTQPTVSAHISSLEQELNVRLFIRNTKEVSLSEDGKILYSHAKQMVSLQKQIEMVFDKTRKEGSHCLRIAASSVPAQYLLPQILAQFSEKYPEEQFKLMETDSAKVVEQVVNYNVDIGFTGTVFEKKHCQYIPFYQDELIIITPNSEKFRKLKEVKDTEDEQQDEDKMWIQKEPVILREEGSGTRREAERLLKNMGINLEDLNIVASMENQETIKRSVSRGIGVSIISRLAAEEELREEKILEFSLGSKQGKRDINVVYNKNFQMSSLAEKFLRVVKGV
ncbi:selenium metabolism-associated LysR family transcriptional regulator [Faecalicatena contorta]|uniref:DNA-binding transcriptional regulator, LysR family n=1 Tax=Faecalicatena contorta TaxID=39482 RepID=A0A315ZV64_9FIRM|nr:selenium metabolism-associated LysR family transcriptional regulator [Faecalicatena contorta]PWJ49395.1 LysR family transcriptional regulator [Faecalicatena contorta]SUQ14639.1 DNA-binding transcriptional regulator, LysR family [Faecalicatena contorta]